MANRTALIVWGGWEGHTPLQSATVVKSMLEGHGFDVTFSDTTEAFASPDVGEHSLIVPVITQSEIGREALSGLLGAIKGGTGLAGFHGTMCDAFRKEPEYQFMTGGQWVAHPGDIIDYRIEITRPDDPIMEGVTDFAYRSEQYYLHVDPVNEVLATTRFDGTYCEDVKGVDMPVVWKRRYGKGRVFYSALGHVADEFNVPEMRTIFERGALWAAR
ncbi:ThuA domain-containing protein [Hoeflea sp. CAU 1731]